jgi:hypothetical protein
MNRGQWCNGGVIKIWKDVELITAVPFALAADREAAEGRDRGRVEFPRSLLPNWKYPHKRRVCLLVNYGKSWFSFPAVPGINGYAIFGTMIMIPGFVSGFAVIKYPAYFEFSLLCDKEGVFEYP